MPRGGARPGAGRPRKPVEHHVLAGTIRPGRHAVRVAALAARPAGNSNQSIWEPSGADLDALQDPGRAFVASYLAAYDVTVNEGGLLLELGHIVDRLSELRLLRADPLSEPKERGAARPSRTRMAPAVRLIRLNAQAGGAMKPRMKADAPPMTDRVACVLLGGWMCEPPGGASPGFSDGFMALAQLREPELVALFRAHESYLRSIAERLGISPQWDVADATPVFFAEALEHELASRTARG